MNDAVAAAVRDNGIVAGVGGFVEAAERGVQWRMVFVRDRFGDTAALMKLRDQAEEGLLTLRVAATSRSHKPQTPTSLSPPEVYAGDQYCSSEPPRRRPSPLVPASMSVLRRVDPAAADRGVLGY